MTKEPVKEPPIFFENGTIEVKIVRNAGHPWNSEGDFDHVYLTAITGDREAMNRVIEKLEKKFWKGWLIGSDNTTGLPCGVLWKPSGIQTDWDPSPGKQ